MLQFELDFEERLQRRSPGRPRNAASWETRDKQCKCGSHIRYTYKDTCVPCQRERAFKYSRARSDKVKAGLTLSYHKIKAKHEDSQTNYILTKIKQTSKKEIA